jgi:hypothetical protein
MTQVPSVKPNPSDRKMKMYILILGVILLIAGIGEPLTTDSYL